MGYIKEPDGIDFVVESNPLTEVEREQISEIIAYYKSTGRKMKMPVILSEQKKRKRASEKKQTM